MSDSKDQTQDVTGLGSPHCYPTRYGFQTGYFKSLEASITMSGPQDADQVSDGVKKVFAEAALPVKFVMIVYEGVNGSEKVDCYNEIKGG